MKTRSKKDKNLSVDLQFQVHTTGEDEGPMRTRSGRVFSKTPQLPTSKHRVKNVSSRSFPGSPVPAETSAEGMDTDEGERTLRLLKDRLREDKRQIGIPEGYLETDTEVPVVASKHSSGESNGHDIEAKTQIEDSTSYGKGHRHTILDVPPYQESDEWGDRTSEIHPPQLVGGAT